MKTSIEITDNFILLLYTIIIAFAIAHVVALCIKDLCHGQTHRERKKKS